MGWGRVEHDVKVYGYGDADGPTKVHPNGKKELPVLQLTRDDKLLWSKCESLDIIGLLEEERGRPLLAPASDRKDLKEWHSRFKPIQRLLYRPRIIKMPIKDFSDEADVKYAKAKYEKKGFDYDDAMKRTPELLKEMDALLVEFDELLHSEENVTELPEGSDCRFSVDDMLYVPDLRTTTVVSGLNWPERVDAYLKNALRSAHIDSYSAHAC